MRERPTSIGALACLAAAAACGDGSTPPAPGDTARGTARLAVTVTSREQIIDLDVLANDSTLLQWTPDDGQAPAWPRHTPLTMPLRVTLPTTPGRYTLRVRALDRAGVSGLSPALAVFVR